MISIKNRIKFEFNFFKFSNNPKANGYSLNEHYLQNEIDKPLNQFDTTTVIEASYARLDYKFKKKCVIMAGNNKVSEIEKRFIERTISKDTK